MRTKMPNVIDAYIQASNNRDADHLGNLFSEDAIVHDEGQEYRGVLAIRKWFESTSRSTRLPSHRLIFAEKHETVLGAQMKRLSWQSLISAFRFVLREGKIARLDISA